MILPLLGGIIASLLAPIQDSGVLKMIGILILNSWMLIKPTVLWSGSIQLIPASSKERFKGPIEMPGEPGKEMVAK